MSPQPLPPDTHKNGRAVGGGGSGSSRGRAALTGDGGNLGYSVPTLSPRPPPSYINKIGNTGGGGSGHHHQRQQYGQKQRQPANDRGSGHHPMLVHSQQPTINSSSSNNAGDSDQQHELHPTSNPLSRKGRRDHSDDRYEAPPSIEHRRNQVRRGSESNGSVPSIATFSPPRVAEVLTFLNHYLSFRKVPLLSLFTQVKYNILSHMSLTSFSYNC